VTYVDAIAVISSSIALKGASRSVVDPVGGVFIPQCTLRIADFILLDSPTETIELEDVDFVRANEQIIANAKLLDYSTLYAEIGEELDDLKWELDEGKKSGWDILNDMFSIHRSITQPDTSEDIASFVKEN
jgi:hypothetical protein